MALITKGEREESAANLVIGAAIEVHRLLGPGYMEAVYEEALAVEFDLRGIGFSRQHRFQLEYKGHKVGRGRVDFLVMDCLPVELKVVATIAGVHRAQVISYLKALSMPLGVLLNFQTPTLREGITRIVR